MMAMRKGLFLGMAVSLSVAAFGADPSWYAKKGTWEETLQASREAFEKREKKPARPASLPNFGRDDFTLMAWVRTKAGGTLLAKAPPTGNWAPQGKALFIGRGRLCYDVGWVGCVESKGQVADGQWHHVALTKKADALQMFIDGQADTAGRLGAEPDVAVHVVKLGYTCPNFPQPPGLTGELDEVRVYRRAFSAAEVKAHAEKLQPARVEGLAGYWPFDDGLADASGSGSDATPSGPIATAQGKHGKALKLNGAAWAVVPAGGEAPFDDLIWPLLERDFHIVRLFDGATLNGWHRRNQPGHGWGSVWAVDDGAIDGVQEWPGALGLLASQHAFASFELQLEAKTDWPIDAGVVLRMAGFGRGYEVTLHCRPDGDVGGLVRRDGDEPHVRAKGWEKVWKKDGWNQLRITIQGSPPQIRTWLNGQPMATCKDDGKGDPLPERGPVALKVHGEQDCFNNHVYFRNIRLFELK